MNATLDIQLTATGDSPLVGVVMGSDSDWPTMEAAVSALAEFGIACEVGVVSAHRMPEDMVAACASSSRAPEARRTCPECSPRSPSYP